MSSCLMMEKFFQFFHGIDEENHRIALDLQRKNTMMSSVRQAWWRRFGMRRTDWRSPKQMLNVWRFSCIWKDALQFTEWQSQTGGWWWEATALPAKRTPTIKSTKYLWDEMEWVDHSIYQDSISSRLISSQRTSSRTRRICTTYTHGFECKRCQRIECVRYENGKINTVNRERPHSGGYIQLCNGGLLINPNCQYPVRFLVYVIPLYVIIFEISPFLYLQKTWQMIIRRICTTSPLMMSWWRVMIVGVISTMVCLGHNCDCGRRGSFGSATARGKNEDL